MQDAMLSALKLLLRPAAEPICILNQNGELLWASEVQAEALYRQAAESLSAASWKTDDPPNAAVQVVHIDEMGDLLLMKLADCLVCRLREAESKAADSLRPLCWNEARQDAAYLLQCFDTLSQATSEDAAMVRRQLHRLCYHILNEAAHNDELVRYTQAASELCRISFPDVAILLQEFVLTLRDSVNGSLCVETASIPFGLFVRVDAERLRFLLATLIVRAQMRDLAYRNLLIGCSLAANHIVIVCTFSKQDGLHDAETSLQDTAIAEKEQLILDHFCNTYGAVFSETETDETLVFRLKLPTVEPDSMFFSAYQEDYAGARYPFNIVQIVLSLTMACS